VTALEVVEITKREQVAKKAAKKANKPSKQKPKVKALVKRVNDIREALGDTLGECHEQPVLQVKDTDCHNVRRNREYVTVEASIYRERFDYTIPFWRLAQRWLCEELDRSDRTAQTKL